MTGEARQIERNVRAHDRVSGIYERIHGEIYNPHEQGRIARELKAVRDLFGGLTRKPLALDFGCGAGNLTAHLLEAGCDVLSSDISERFLALVQQKYAVRTFKLNGVDLAGIEDNSLDVVATYSVLHHIPDYLGILDEFCRVLRPGGILYIDHETSMNVWRCDAVYVAFQQLMRERQSLDWWKYLNVYNYLDFVVRATVNSRYRREGDIHVFPDDHIDWAAITRRLEGRFSVVTEKSYLLFKRCYRQELYDEYADRTSDMQLMVFRKHG